MALDNQTFNSASSTVDNQEPRAYFTQTHTAILAEVTGADRTLPALTPMARVTASGDVVPWDKDGAGGSQTIVGFVWPSDAVQYGSAGTTGENNIVLGYTGEVHIDDIDLTQCPNSPVLADLQAAVTASDLRGKGILVRGYKDI